eukprot:TRINITY_DN7977_c0_g1_i2.p1 TRINITY_DN7977_c0_g1~~TRINITY_DN7977_c0_g1_i2.p1  ORF type:complete len:337 (-),score=56.57 TRINITY_DN7977_c0_g1_i2:436-1446(-)
MEDDDRNTLLGVLESRIDSNVDALESYQIQNDLLKRAILALENTLSSNVNIIEKIEEQNSVLKELLPVFDPTKREIATPESVLLTLTEPMPALTENPTNITNDPIISNNDSKPSKKDKLSNSRGKRSPSQKPKRPSFSKITPKVKDSKNRNPSNNNRVRVEDIRDSVSVLDLNRKFSPRTRSRENSLSPRYKSKYKYNTLGNTKKSRRPANRFSAPRPSTSNTLNTRHQKSISNSSEYTPPSSPDSFKINKTRGRYSAPRPKRRSLVYMTTPLPQRYAVSDDYKRRSSSPRGPADLGWIDRPSPKKRRKSDVMGTHPMNRDMPELLPNFPRSEESV